MTAHCGTQHRDRVPSGGWVCAGAAVQSVAQGFAEASAGWPYAVGAWETPVEAETPRAEEVLAGRLDSCYLGGQWPGDWGGSIGSEMF
jgi:hypothetical protein